MVQNLKGTEEFPGSLLLFLRLTFPPQRSPKLYGPCESLQKYFMHTKMNIWFLKNTKIVESYFCFCSLLFH